MFSSTRTSSIAGLNEFWLTGRCLPPSARSPQPQLINRKSGAKDEDFGSVADCDTLLLLAGDPAGEEEPTKKGVAFQVRPFSCRELSRSLKICAQTWLLGYEFPTTFLLLKNDKLHVLCSAKKGTIFPHHCIPDSHRLLAKILSQVATPKSPVPVNILVLAKGKESATNALPEFLEAYTSSERVGTLVKERHTGKMIDEWNTAVEGAASKPTVVDIASAISGFVAVKDDDELVSAVQFVHFSLLMSFWKTEQLENGRKFDPDLTSASHCP